MLPTLKTERLLIRPFEAKDAKAVYLLTQEAAYAKWLPNQVYADETEASQVLSFLISQYVEPLDPREKPLVFAVAHLSQGKVIGHVGLSPLNGEVEIGYAMSERETGKGLATEAVTCVSRWAIRRLQLANIAGIVEVSNVASLRVLEKTGYQLKKEVEQLHQGKMSRCRTYGFS